MTDMITRDENHGMGADYEYSPAVLVMRVRSNISRIQLREIAASAQGSSHCDQTLADWNEAHAGGANGRSWVTS